MKATRLTAGALIAVVLLAAPAAARVQSETPRQAFVAISTCLTHRAHALKIERESGWGGRAYFARPFNHLGSWVSWAYITVDGRVAGTTTVRGGSHLPVKAVNRCLAPFNGRA